MKRLRADEPSRIDAAQLQAAEPSRSHRLQTLIGMAFFYVLNFFRAVFSEKSNERKPIKKSPEKWEKKS